MQKRVGLPILCCMLLLSICGTSFAATLPELRGFKKEDYPTEDAIMEQLAPNVFFLLDIGSPMSFSPKGTMPVDTDGKSTAQHIAMFQHATYGSGARPLAYRNNSSGVITESTGQRVSKPNGGYNDGYNAYPHNSPHGRYGRDLDTDNNIIGNEDCYYSPDKDRPYLLTFRHPTWANWNGKGSLPSVSGIPSAVQTAISTYLSTPVASRMPITDPNVIEHLVPNDSRMYQMKLVMYRLLTDNAAMLAKMKVAMGTSYFEINPGAIMWADFYKYPPYDARTFSGHNFLNGAGPGWCDAVLPNSAAPYNDSMYAYQGIDRDLYTGGNTEWWRVNRAVMLLPFDYLYKVQADGSIQAQDNLSRFLQYIDGQEVFAGSIGSGTVYNPEFFADGKTPLATSIYARSDVSGRSPNSNLTAKDNYGNYVIRYASQTNRLTYGSQRVDLETYNLNDEKTGGTIRGGGAVGSVIDFFSPPASGVTALTFNKDTNAGFFPITNSCQKNWLVVFTAGNDSDGLTGEKAVELLYKKTKTVNGRLWDGSKWVNKKNLDMDSGVRTLVVGFVDETNTDSSVVALRTTLTNMAQWGDPKDDGSTITKNTDAKPYFANDVPSLIASLRSVLLRINADRYSASAPMILPDAVGTDNTILSASYAVDNLDQWDGFFTRYKLRESDSSVVKMWEANNRMSTRRATRQIYSFKHLAGENGNAMETLESLNLTTYAGIPATHEADFKKWMREYGGKVITDESGGGTTVYSVMGDMEHSGFGAALTGTIRTLYVQTNRGVLHAINEDDGAEKWAFIPPNVLQGRVKPLKFDDFGTWVDSALTGRLKSFAMNLLDGSVTVKDNSLMIGNLGWGGNSFYAMDVSSIGSKPTMLWAVDNERYGTSPTDTSEVRVWGNAAVNKRKQSGSNYDYRDLGLTIVPPAFLKIYTNSAGTITENFGLMAGGLGYSLGADLHGKALFVFDSENANILRKLNQDSGYKKMYGRDLGMMITPFAYLRNRTTGVTSQFYTADSLGNVLFCDVDKKSLNSWEMESIFQVLSTEGTPLVIPRSVAVADAPRTKDRWVYIGTADLMTPDYSATRQLVNPEQYIVGVNTSQTVGGETTNSSTIHRLNYENDGTTGQQDNNAPLAAVGWLLKLAAATATTEAEYVTTSPFLYAGTLYVSTFIPSPSVGEGDDECASAGNARLYAFDPQNGAGKWEGHHAVTIKNVKIAGMTAHDGKLYIGVKAFTSDAFDHLPSEMKNAEKFDSIWRLDAITSGGTDHPWDPMMPYVDYWQERF